MEQAQPGVRQAVVASELSGPTQVTGQHAGPFDRVEGAIEGPRDGRFHEPLAQADAELAGEDLDDALGRRRVRAGQEVGQDGRFGAGTGRVLDRFEGGGDLGQVRARLGRRGVAHAFEHVLHGEAQVRMPVIRPPDLVAVHPGDLDDRPRDRRATESGRALVGLGEGPAGQKDDRDGKLGGGQGGQVSGQERGLLGRPGGRPNALRQVAPAAHGGDGIRLPEWRLGRGFRSPWWGRR